MATFAHLLEQEILTVPSFTFESGYELRDVPVAYKTWGKLNERRDNVMIICHAFTGSSDVEDWWGPLMGPGKAFDPTRYFIFCANVLGSPYGSASPVTTNPDTGALYGPEFPATTIRDDVHLHKHVLDYLGVTSVAAVIGGSMGGMAVLEWPLCTPPSYIRHIVPIATSARHSAWCISWGEAQRQAIYADPLYADGYYDRAHPPAAGLAAARMAALLTYRSRDSFESRFGRTPQPSRAPSRAPSVLGGPGLLTPPQSPLNPAAAARAAHNDGARSSSKPGVASPAPPPQIFSAQSYLRYQGDKFTARFDANCYIHITRKLDTHDLARDRFLPSDDTPLLASAVGAGPEDAALAAQLARLPRALVISIDSDGLFTPSEQRTIARHVPGAKLVVVPSPEGHDGFLLEFEAINGHILRFLRAEMPELYAPGTGVDVSEDNFEIKKTSMFGEAEADVTAW